MTTAEALLIVVFAPLATGAALVVVPRRAWAPLGWFVWLATGAALAYVTVGVVRDGPERIALAGVDAPLGVAWRVDPFAVSMLWLALVVGAIVTVHARATIPPGTPAGRRFWPLWWLLVGSVHALFLSADLFNLYVTLELVTISAVALITVERSRPAIEAAMRYLLLGLLASLFYLLATGLIYGRTGTLDLYLLAQRWEPDLLTAVALALLVAALLLKSAIVPLHVWLPPAHAHAPGPVSAILSALVVKTSLYVLLRLWYWGGADRIAPDLGPALGVLAAAAVLYGSWQAIVQVRAKHMVAYSTVAQLGYVLLAFPLIAPEAFRAATLHLVAHGAAKAGMFLAVANLIHAVGSDRISALRGVDRIRPVDVMAFALAGVSLMGLPPSGGFLAKWSFLQAAWSQQAYGVVALLSVGSLAAAVYVFRVIAAFCARPEEGEPLEPGEPVADATEARPAPRAASLAALALALLAITSGLAAEPWLSWLASNPPPGGGP